MIRTAAFEPVGSPVENRLVGDWVSQLLYGRNNAFQDFCSLAVLDGERIIGATLYHGWEPKTGVVELSGGGIDKRWLTRPALRAIFFVPFRMLGCQMIVHSVAESNEAMCSIHRRLGYSEYRVPRLRGRDEAGIIFTMTDDQWRSSWLSEGLRDG